MLKLNVEQLKREIDSCGGYQIVGKLRSAMGMLTADLPAAVHDLCEIRPVGHAPVLAEVVGFDRNGVRLMPFLSADRLSPGDEVSATGRRLTVPCGVGLLGRILGGLGEPIDGGLALTSCDDRQLALSHPPPLSRPRIAKPLITGQRVIDGMLTVGLGQRVGLFSGSGIGKSTLLGEIAKGASADVNVIALIGERGREVRPFIEDCLGQPGLQKSVVVVATSDELPLMRIQAVRTAVTIAEFFRQDGADVLFLLDSITRMAAAQREIGLHLGEPPTSRGYPPSVFGLLSNVLERFGSDENGTITAILTVLVEGDEMEEPIADAVRSVADGHIVLSRTLAEKGQFPAVDVLRSVSRVFREVTPDSQQASAQTIRRILATHAEVADLVRVGAYARGASAEVDSVLTLLPHIQSFLEQPIGERASYENTVAAMNRIAAQHKI